MSKLLFIFLSTVLLLTGASAAPEGKGCKDGDDCLEAGKVSFSSGRLQEAAEFYRQSMKFGNRQHAAFGLGAALAELGDYAGAIAALKQSCTEGLEGGCENEKQTVTFVSQLKKERQGLAKQWTKLGVQRLENGHLETAEVLLTKACVASYPPGCSRLGEVEDVLGKREVAKKHFAQGCSGKDYEGCRLLGVFEYRSGNRDGAKKLFETGCKNKHYKSCGFLAGIEQKNGNLTKAMDLLETSCKHDVLESCETLAFNYSKAKNDEKLRGTVDRMKKLLQPQCDNGRADACRRLASLR